MASENFIDYVKIHCKSGAGGAGFVHFRREKAVEHGGPDGGNGGRGGHVILKGNSQLWTLLHLKYRKHIMASSGVGGQAANCTGADGDDEILEVPIGTIAKDAETGETILEITEDGQKAILLPGGRGGLGNTNFKNSINQAPQYAQPGEPFQEKWVILELKLLADVGLVGFPNAGKSSLLSKVSASKTEIGDYPFTTLTPHLGVVQYRNYKSFVMADIPGIIEGASEGKGLGIRFLRHIERNSILLFLIPSDSKDIVKEYKILINELQNYNPELLDKKRILAISKSDLLDEELKDEIKKELAGKLDLKWLFISTFHNKGIDELKDLIWQSLHEA